MNTLTLKDASTTQSAELVARAREAFEQKRNRDCLVLTKQVLAADPANAEAQILQNTVLADVEHDLNDARALLLDSQKREDGAKYRKAAEIVLLKILYLDPSHDEAKALLAQAKGASPEPHAPAPLPQPVASPVLSEGPKPKPSRAEDETVFTARPKPFEKKLSVERPGSSRKLPLVLGVFVVLAGGAVGLKTYASRSTADSATVADKQSPAGTSAVPASPAPVAPAPAADSAVSTKPDVSTAAVAPAPPAPAPAAPTPVAAEPGYLAVSSPTAADIYLGDKYLGSTPTTLQLPAGRQTLEYRHGDLRSVMTHDVKAKETTTALVTFEITVQINARPWAQVFVEGTTRKALGQTPLSSVRVPIGSVVTFENPNFPSKNHRITDKDSSIQMVFP